MSVPPRPSDNASAPRPTSDELAECLRDGPFDQALALAVNRRGLTLDRLHQHLTDLGAPVSVTALSYWIRGLRRPEQPTSLAALPHLERVLDLPSGALQRLLERPRRRSRRDVAPIPLERLWAGAASLRSALRRLDLEQTHLAISSAHQKHWLDETGADLCIRHHWAVQARRDAVQRYKLLLCGVPDLAQVIVDPARGASVQRSILTDDGFGIWELLLDHRLYKGERTMLELEVRFPRRGPASAESVLRLDHRAQLSTYEVFFHPDRLPAAAFTVRHPAGSSEEVHGVRVRDGVLRAAFEDPGAGNYGLRWTWPPSTGPADQVDISHISH